MRIISDFHDYYDCIQKYGQDDLIFERKSQTFNEQELKLPYVPYTPSNFNDYIIGFCGKLYPFLHYYRNGEWDSENYCYKNISYNFYDFESADAFIQKQLSKKELKTYLDNKVWGNWRARQKEIKEFFNSFNNIKCDDYFFNYGSPILFFAKSGREWNVIANPQLKDYGFQKVFDTYKCFQELSMFISNTAKPIKPIPTIPDEIMCEIKGFDKFSFRKEKKNAV
jgi:hypothetical protein